MSESPKPERLGFDSGNLLALATVLVGVVSAWLYAAGRTYAYSYYGAYGLGLIGLGIPQQDYLVFGALLVRAHALPSVLLLTAAVGIAWTLRRVLGAGWMLLWLCIVVFIAFQIAFATAPELARRHILEDQNGDYRAQPLVEVLVGPAWSAEPGFNETAAAFRSGCYRLLLSGEQRLVLFRPSRDAPTAELVTVILGWHEVRELRVLPQGRSCP